MEQCEAAVRGGANQLELCARLDLDGLTPSNELVQQVVERFGARVRAKMMIRNVARADFSATRDDVEEMLQSIDDAKRLGVHGVVFGFCKQSEALPASLTLDLDAIATLVRAAKPMEVTIHKAVDATTDVEGEVTRLLDNVDGIDCILTSGGHATALEGASVLRRLRATMTTRGVRLIVAGRVTRDNFELVHAAIDSDAYHGRRIVCD